MQVPFRRLFGSWVLVPATAALIVAACGASLSSSSIDPGQPSCAGVAEPSLGCLTSTPLPPGGISREAAIVAARRTLAGGDSASVIWTSVEPNPFILPRTSGAVVWEVRLADTLRELSPCPPGWLDHVPTPWDPPCIDADAGIVVVLDYSSGTFLGWIH